MTPIHCFAPFACAILLCVGAITNGNAQTLSVLNSLDVGSGCGAAYDSVTGDLWRYDCSANTIRRYSTTGEFLGEIDRPGEAANDVDIDFATSDLTLGSTLVPAGSLLFINGETGPADIYALDTETGAVIATLETAFGVSHVVGGGYHESRDSFFLVQDSVPDTVADNLIAEVDAQTGAILNLFDVDQEGFSVFFGDLDVSKVTGNLYIVSSSESSIAQFSPEGVPLPEIPLPAGVSGLAGIGIHDLAGQAWVAGGGRLWQLGGLYPVCDFDDDGACDIADLNLLLAEGPIAGGVPTIDGANDQFDLTGDDRLNNEDVDAWLANAAANNGLNSTYRRGDANLDGFVDVSDFNTWNGSKFTSTLQWNNGDFNGDGVADASDFNLWNSHKFTSSNPTMTVPEPSDVWILFPASLWIATRFRRLANQRALSH